jgi:hypothetical protein
MRDNKLESADCLAVVSAASDAATVDTAAFNALSALVLAVVSAASDAAAVDASAHTCHSVAKCCASFVALADFCIALAKRGWVAS